MRAALKTSTILVLSTGVLMGASTLSTPQTTPSDNIFNADLTAPSIKLAVQEFEKVCLPFIAHETELTPEQDKAVFHSKMTELGYEFNAERQTRETFPLRQFTHSPTSCPAPLSTPIPDGKFTIFPGQDSAWDALPKQFISDGKTRIVSSENTTLINAGCEIFPVSITPARKTNYTQQHFEKARGQAIIASLTWQDIPNNYLEGLPAAQARKFALTPSTIRLRTQFPPASRCEIHAVASDISLQDMTDAIIMRDADWTKRADVKDHKTGELLTKAHMWEQCTTQNDEHYVYFIGLRDKSLSIKIETLQDDAFAAQHNCRTIETEIGAN